MTEQMQGGTPVIREHHLLIDELDMSIIEMMNADALAAIYLRRTAAGYRRGNGMVVFNDWEACFRKVTSLTRNLPELNTDKTPPRVLADVDWWLDYDGLPKPSHLQRGREILAEYMKLLYEKGIIQIKR